MSMPLDQFPVDPNRVIQQLARRVAALEARLNQGQALKIEKATGPFLIPDGVITTPGGSPVPLLGPASDVSDPPDFQSSDTAPATYTGTTQAMLTQLREDAAGTKIALDGLLLSLRLADHLA